MEWVTVKDRQPKPHDKYLLRRDGNWYTAKPCYGMHAPWWVVQSTHKGEEHPPVDMLDTDEWCELPGSK